MLARPYGVVKIDAAPRLTVIAFRPNPPVDAARIVALVQGNRHIKLAGNDKLRIERALPEAKDRAQLVRDVLRALGTPKAPREGPPHGGRAEPARRPGRNAPAVDHGPVEPPPTRPRPEVWRWLPGLAVLRDYGPPGCATLSPVSC